MNPFDFLLYFFSFIFLLPLIVIFYPRYKIIQGYLFSSYPVHKNSFGSFANPINVKKGYTWTNSFKLFKKFNNDKNTVFIDQFRFDEDYAYQAKIPSFLKNYVERQSIHFSPLQMTQGILLVGKMGSGKSEAYHKILQQDFYNRAVIHETKVGDFTEPYFRKRVDILFSPYDERTSLWDVMSEDEGTVKTFFENYMNAIQGDKKDFFSAAANRKYNETAQKIRSKYKNESSHIKWKLFIKAIKELLEESASKDQNSVKDVASTMEAVLEPLEIMAWMMQNPKQKKFVIRDFFNKKMQCKLILGNNPEYEKSLSPLFSAFTAALSQIHTSMPDSKTDFTLYALDEYLTFASTMDDASKKRLHTLIRSKGGILIPGIQYVPKDDKKLQQMLTSSAFAWIYFSSIEEETISLLKKTIGETEYYYEDVSESWNKGKKSKSYSTKNEKTSLISNDILNNLGEKFEHITYLPNMKMLYKGYTPQVELKPRAKKTVPKDLTAFYEMRYQVDDVQDENLDFDFADLFKQKKLSALDEFRAFKRFEKSRIQGEDGIKEFVNKELPELKNKKIAEIDFELMFKKYLPDNKIVDSKMKVLTIDERFELSQQWNSINKENHQAQLDFIEEHQLWGAIPTIFDFSQDEISDLQNDF